MAFLLTSLGADLASSALGALVGPHAGKQAGHAPGATPAGPYASSFGAVLHGHLGALRAGDPLAQLTAVVQNGTPISTIVDRLAGRVADALGRHVPSAQLGAGASRIQLVNSIKAALSPPSNAPPGTDATQQVAALAQRLQGLITGVARGADQRVGQQSDTSGQVLDASRARELPAQPDPVPASSSLDPAALATSLLGSIAASFSSPATAAGVSGAQLGTAASALPATSGDAARALAAATSQSAKEAATGFSTFARLQTQIVSQTGKDSPATVALASDPSAAGASQDAASTAQLQQQQQQQSLPQGAPATAPSPGADPADLLARMLLRASGVDARFNANLASAAAATQGTAGAARPADSGGTMLPSAAQGALAGRITALLSAAVSAAASGGGSSNSNAAFTNNGGAALTTMAAAPAKGPAAKPVDASFATAFSASSTATAAPSTASSSSASASSSPQADPNAIVEQVVKGMAMRTGSDGTSELRLRLQPESLGTVTMKLTISGTSVSASAIAQNADVRSALMAHQDQLARSLADAGLKLTGFSVDLSGGDANRDRLHDRTTGFGRPFRVHDAGAVDPSTESLAAGPALLPRSTLELFNYLA